MIPFIIIETMLMAARSSGTTQKELDEAMLKLIAWVLGFLFLCLLVWVFTDPQFCFRRQFIELWDTIIKIC